MIGNIRKPNPFHPFDPSVFFDANNTISESDFINKILDRGHYSETIIGKFVTISNSVECNNGLYVIADVNHDSDNTGQTNCYDLISVDCFHTDSVFGNSGYWAGSPVQSWLNNTFYPGYSSELKAHVMDMKYNSEGSWYTNKVIMPSTTEVGNEKSFTEGIMYPIFSSINSSRIKNLFGTSTATAWWTRTRYPGTSNLAWTCSETGSIEYAGASSYQGKVALLRVQ